MWGCVNWTSKEAEKQLLTSHASLYGYILIKSKLSMVIAEASLSDLASYPGLLTPVFFACRTNAEEGLVKPSHMQWHTWTCGGVAHSQKNCKWACYWSQIQTVEWLSARHQTALVKFLELRKPLYSCTEGMCHSSTCPGMSLHVTQFYQIFPHVSTVRNKHWGEKAWVQGYIWPTLLQS